MFKKLTFLALAILLFVGVAEAANWQTVTRPYDSSEVAIMNVYLNSSTAADDGDVLVWDIDASSGDEYMWVVQTTVADTGPIAGVAYGTIAANSVGQIVIFGQYDVDIVDTNSSGGISTLVITSTTSGSGNPVGLADSPTFWVGYLMETTDNTTTSASVMVQPGCAAQ